MSEKDVPEDDEHQEPHGHDHEGSFAEGQSEHDPDEDPHGDFAEGQEVVHREPERVERGTYSEGQAADGDVDAPERGDFAEGQDDE